MRFTSIALLMAVSPAVLVSGDTIFLAVPGRAGFFTWSSLDMSALVATDPGQGIYVASAASSLGIAGAWVRQWSGAAVDWCWWGARSAVPTVDPWGLLGTGPTVGSGPDNAVAFINLGKWARTNDSVVIEPSPGTYLWNGAATSGTDSDGNKNIAYSWTYGIRDLTINGKGVVALQNTYREDVSGNNSGASSCFPLNLRKALKGYLINETVPGSRTFSFINPADAANVFPGMVVSLGSNDGQYLGYPPNTQQTEYVTVLSVSGGTVTTIEPIKYNHRTDFPDFTESPGFACGAARVWVNPQLDWNGTLIVKGMQVNKTPGLVGSQPYATLNKRSVVTENWVGCGFSETSGRDFTHHNPTLFTNGEVDKMMDQIIYNNLQGPSGISLQSASPNRLIVNGGSFGGIAGCGRQLLVKGARIGQFSIIDQFGAGSFARLENCDVQVCAPASMGYPVDGAILNVIDGVNAQFVPPGNFVLNCSALGLAGNINKWGVVPGMYVNLQAATPLGNTFSGDLGTGYVISSTWDGTNTITIATDLNFPGGLPAWASGSVYLFKVNDVTVVGCTGNDIIRQMSDATAAGQRYFEYRRFQFAGITGQSMSIDNPAGTTLVGVDVNVQKPHATTSTAVLTLIVNSVQSPGMTMDTGGISIRTQLGFAGLRSWSQAGSSGLNPSGATLDRITVGGAAASAIPADRLIGSTSSVQLFSSAPTPGQSPRGEVVMRFSAGMVRKPITRQYDDSGTISAAHAIFPAQSQIL